MISHEVFEAATDPVIGNSWVTNTGLFSTDEGGDQCENQVTSLPFGDVQKFTDNNVQQCTSFTNSTTTHIGAISDGSNTLDVFWPTSTPGILTHAWLHGGWSSEQVVDPTSEFGGVQFLGAPSVVRTTPTRLDVFVEGSDSMIHHFFKDRAVSNGWSVLGQMGFANGQPSAVSWSTNRVDVFALGTDSSLMHFWAGDATNFSGESLGGQTRGVPRAISRGPGLLDIFTMGMPGDVVEMSWNNGWSGFHTIVGGSNGWGYPPTVTSWDINRKDVFIAPNHGLSAHTAWQTSNGWNGGWGGWQYTIGSAETPPRSPFGMDVTWQGQFYRSAFYQGYNKAAGAWTATLNLGGVYNGPPTIAEGLDGHVYIVGAGTDGCLYYTVSTAADRSTWAGPNFAGVCGLM